MSNNISKGISVVQSSFISTDNKGLLIEKVDEKSEQENIKNSIHENINDTINKEPKVIPSSFISPSDINSKVKSNNLNNINNLNSKSKPNFNSISDSTSDAISNLKKKEVVKKMKKDIKMKNNVKKAKTKIFKGNKITRILKEEYNNAEIDDCWIILQSIKPEFHSVRMSKKYFKECYIGRHERNYLQINSDLISNLHCKIYYKHKDDKNPNSPIEVYIKDTSTNGTFINGEIIGKGKSRQIYHGQEIGFIINSKRGHSGAYIVIIPRPNEIPGEYERSIEEDYQITELLGSGNFADVKKGVHRYTSENVAIKILAKEKLMLKSSSKMVISLEREINILKSIKHENIIQIYDVYEDEKYVYLVLELAKGGELFDRIKEESLTEPQARKVMKQLFEALKYLHTQGIAHIDLKPENILLVNDNEFTIKISDFGLARFVDENFYMKTLCGTLTYAAPEVTDIMKNKEGKYTVAVDMWSCGVILFVCLCGYLPFNEGQQIKKNSVLFKSPYWDNISKEAKDLVKGLLTIDPDKRLNVLQALQHPFIVGHEENKNLRKRTLEIESNSNENGDNTNIQNPNHTESSLYINDFSPSRSLSSLSIRENEPLAKRQKILFIVL
ncbi:Pkinase-domain-containing protein [Anaeromyces robustus]|uniref:Pkinase-domain-containing protein n=1 Tax=Anaeromyces robustus TaxID=1754192 RepID=A0A1Y1XPH6_9FUNG|nr:Pkinase-domain-containing protein [Anaeromyces robustus]|eukprot:ORX87642.1 Pkinase-domain-containing protein [Anaeromyces robustus]